MFVFNILYGFMLLLDMHMFESVSGIFTVLFGVCQLEHNSLLFLLIYTVCVFFFKGYLMTKCTGCQIISKVFM